MTQIGEIMLNNDLKREAIERLKVAQKNYQETVERVTKLAEELYEERMASVAMIDFAVNYLKSQNGIAINLYARVMEIQVDAAKFRETGRLAEELLARETIATGSGLPFSSATTVGVAAIGLLSLPLGVALAGYTALMNKKKAEDAEQSIAELEENIAVLHSKELIIESLIRQTADLQPTLVVDSDSLNSDGGGIVEQKVKTLIDNLYKMVELVNRKID